MQKTTKQIILSAIISKLEKGLATEKICSAICSKFQFTERTFYNHFKKANLQHIEKQELIKSQLDIIEVESAKERKKRDIMDADDRREWLTSMILKKTKVMKVGGSTQMVHEYQDADGRYQTEIISYDHKLKALAELNKMDGDYAPAKIAMTDTDGNAVPRLLTDDQFNQALKAAREDAKTNRGE